MDHMKFVDYIFDTLPDMQPFTKPYKGLPPDFLNPVLPMALYIVQLLTAAGCHLLFLESLVSSALAHLDSWKTNAPSLLWYCLVKQLIMIHILRCVS